MFCKEIVAQDAKSLRLNKHRKVDLLIQLLHGTVFRPTWIEEKVTWKEKDEMAWVDQQELEEVVDENLCTETGWAPISLKWVDIGIKEQKKSQSVSGQRNQQVKTTGWTGDSIATTGLKVLCSLFTSKKRSTRSKPLQDDAYWYKQSSLLDSWEVSMFWWVLVYRCLCFSEVSSLLSSSQRCSDAVVL